MRACRVLIDKRIINKASLRISLGLGGILSVGLALGYLSHLCLFAGYSNEIFAVVREFGDLITFKTSKNLLEHVECSVSVQLECNGRQQLTGLELLDNIIQIVADIFLRLQRWRFLCNSELLVQLGMRTAEVGKASFQSSLVFLSLVQSDAFVFINVLVKEVVRIVQFFQGCTREHRFQSFPQGHHIVWSHSKGGNEFWLILQSVRSHRRYGMELR
mmetsp:Transcript_3837/g.9297  ORF Transcript_3837/g.9297 Transcript_3837/m.9297 type:complete len:216 (+) Transcript_3837:457-1104(+)